MSKATKVETAKIMKLWKRANNTPSFGVTSAQVLGGRDFASIAWDDLYDTIDELAVKHGFKRLKNHYGFDPKKREFIKP